MFVRLTILSFLLLTAGCRESLIGPDEAAPPVDPTTTVDNDAISYIKAPEVLIDGETVQIWAGPLVEGAEYRWSQSGSGAVRFETAGNRFTNISADQTGAVRLRCDATGLDGGSIGYEEVEITVAAQ